MAAPDRLAAERLRTALELADLADAMMRAKARRELPAASDDGIERRVLEWWERRPGAEDGDAEGRRREWPPR